MAYGIRPVKPLYGRSIYGVFKMHDCKVTPAMASVIKLARSLGISYSWITGYYHGLNFGRIADVMKGRLFPEVAPAKNLPPDFPTA